MSRRLSAVFQRRYLYWLLQIAVVAGWFVFLRPVALGGPASYVIVSGRSMEPTLLSGDFVFAFRQGNYSIGDLVAFRVPAGEPGEGAAVIHRIVGQEGQEFITQGDNSGQPDTWRPTAQDILGRLRFSLPGGGLAVQWLRQPVVLGAIAGLLGMSFVLAGGKPAEKKPRRAPSAPRAKKGASLHAWDHRPMREPASVGGDFPVSTTRPAEEKAIAWPPPTVRGERTIPTKDLLRWGRMDRRVVLRHPLPPEAEVYLVHSGNRTHWVLGVKREGLAKETEKGVRP